LIDLHIPAHETKHMKKLFALFLLLPIFSTAQEEYEVTFPMDSITHKITYTDVVKVDSASAQDLYSRGKYFVANAFKNAQAVSMLNDDQATTIVCKGTMKAYMKSLGLHQFGYISFTLKIFCKDGRYKYVITDLVHSNPGQKNPSDGGALEDEKADCGGFYLPKKNWQQIKSYADGDIFLLLEELKKTLAVNQKNDW
jgi:hypothetical protein